jgi:hypothetical protein
MSQLTQIKTNNLIVHLVGSHQLLLHPLRLLHHAKTAGVAVRLPTQETVVCSTGYLLMVVNLISIISCPVEASGI